MSQAATTSPADAEPAAAPLPCDLVELGRTDPFEAMRRAVKGFCDQFERAAMRHLKRYPCLQEEVGGADASAVADAVARGEEAFDWPAGLAGSTLAATVAATPAQVWGRVRPLWLQPPHRVELQHLADRLHISRDRLYQWVQRVKKKLEGAVEGTPSRGQKS